MGSPLADQQQRSLQENNRDQGFLSYGSRTRPAHHSLPPLVDPVVTAVPKGKHFTCMGATKQPVFLHESASKKWS